MESMELAFSPCPNDTFIFDAWVNKRIQGYPQPSRVRLDDVEALNRAALEGRADVTKLSFGALPFVADRYQVLDSGSALGFGCGPMLIAARPIEPHELPFIKVAIPGKYTTANLLLHLAFPEIAHRVEMVFSDIEGAILRGEVDAGLIIHESRFTYAQKGLQCIRDLGAWWEDTQHLPIPLGCIVVKRSLPETVKLELERAIRESLESARAHPEQSREYVSAHAQEMDAQVMQQHIDLYVNDFSLSLGKEGRRAVHILMDAAYQAGWIPEVPAKLFVSEP